MVKISLSGSGEGSGSVTAPGYSTFPLSDIFAPARRAFILGVFYMSVPLGSFVAWYGGGWVAQEYGWRAALLLAGVPGLLLAILLFATVREPVRGAFDEPVETDPSQPPGDAPTLRETARGLLAAPGLLVLVAACALCGFVAISTGAWFTSFFIRVHTLELKDVGLVLGVAGVVGIAGPPVVGWLADRAAERSPKGPLYLVACAVVIGMGFGWVAMFSERLDFSIVTFVLFYFLTHSYTPPLYAVLMAKTPVRMRGTVMSLLQLVTNLIGFGIGASWVGLVSDSLGGGEAIRTALAVAMSALLGVAGLLLLAGRMLFGDGSRIEAGSVP